MWNKKHNKTVTLARSKLNSSKTLISQALKGLGISHEGNESNINKEVKCRRIKEKVVIKIDKK